MTKLKGEPKGKCGAQGAIEALENFIAMCESARAESDQSFNVILRHLPPSFGLAQAREALSLLRSLPSSTDVPSYSMSRDYEALWEHMLKGDEAIGYSWERHKPREVQDLSVWHSIHWKAVMTMGKPVFLAECQRLNLQWLSPSKEPETHIGKADIEFLRKHIMNAVVDCYCRDLVQSGDGPCEGHRSRQRALDILELAVSAPKEPASSPEGVVSVDRLMEKVVSWTSCYPEMPTDNEGLRAMWNDLRERLTMAVEGRA